MRALLARIDARAPAWETELLGVELQGAELFHFQVGPTLAATGAAGGVLRVRAGVTFPIHSHHGHEVTFVLEGLYVTDDGHAHGPGSILEMPADTTHAYRAGPPRDLVLMVLHHGITMLNDPPPTNSAK